MAAGLGLFTSKPFEAGATVLSVTDPDYLARAMSHAEITAAGFSHADIFQVGTRPVHPALWRTRRLHQP